MTFSAQIKEELCTLPIKNPDAVLAECCGMILFANSATKDKIKIITENQNIAHRASRLLKSLFGFDFDRKIIPASAMKKFNLIIDSPLKLQEIYSAFGFDYDHSPTLHLNAAIVESDDARAAFCRGAFLTGGSTTDPESTYHLELVTSHNVLSREVISLLFELNLPAKLTSRKTNNIIYFKESSHIEDFLTHIGAPLSALEFMQAKLVKDLRNNINRHVNCEVANMTKTADAAKLQLQAINSIKSANMFESLSPQLQHAANLRLDNPDLSLSELSALTDGEVGKSGLNHRLNKLITLANEITSRKEK